MESFRHNILLYLLLLSASVGCHDSYSIQNLSGSYSGTCFYEEKRFENGNYTISYDTSYNETLKIEVKELDNGVAMLHMNGNCIFPNDFFAATSDFSNDTLVVFEHASVYSTKVTFYLNTNTLHTDYLMFQMLNPGSTRIHGNYEKQ